MSVWMQDGKRRALLRMGLVGAGAFGLSGCQSLSMVGGMASTLMGGSAATDLATLGREFADGLKIIAGQTDKLMSIQADYAGVMGLKDEQRKLRAQARNLRRGDSFGASELDTSTSLSAEAALLVTTKIRQAESLSNRQKQALARGQSRHAEAVRDMWVGVALIGTVVLKAPAAQPPSLADVRLVNTFQEITETGPKALAFADVSKETYQEYVEAFEYKGIYVPPANRKLDLPMFGFV